MGVVLFGLVPKVADALSAPEAQAPMERYQLEIQRMRLSEALKEFGEQTHLQIAHFSDVEPVTLTVGPLHGAYTREEALKVLLRGTGLTFLLVNDRTIAIVKESTPQGHSADPKALPPELQQKTPAPDSSNRNGNDHKTQENNGVNEKTDEQIRNHGLIARLVAMFALCSVAAIPSGPACAQAAANAQGTTAQPEALEEIVVTALRTASLESKTPISMTAITGTSLRDEGVMSPMSLGDLVPNLQIERNNGLQVTIRGVTSTDNTEKGDPSASVLLDGIYIARPQVQDTSFYDIARVEVLRGPQGTLYGRNTTAGVVNIITNQPSNTFEAAANASAGSYNAYQGDAMVNVPVSDALALRAAVSYDRRDSYLRKAPGDPFDIDPFRKDVSARVQALLHFGSNASFLLKMDYSQLEGTENPYFLGSRAAVMYNLTDPENPIYKGASTATLLQVPYQQKQQGYQKNDTSGISGELNWDFGPVGLTYLGGYRRFVRDEAGTGNLSPAPGLTGLPAALTFTGEYQQISQELRLATTGNGPFKGQAGLYYFREHSGIAFFILDLVGPYFGFPQDPIISESKAAFAQVTYSVIPTLRVTAGARYSEDNKSRIGGTVFQQGPAFNPATDTRNLNSAASSSSKTTWRVGVDYDVADRTLLYGSIATGYKAGGFNDGCEAGTTTNGVPCNQPRSLAQLYYLPETLTAYELGVKSTLANNMVQLKGAAFYYDYKDLQLSTIETFSGAPSQLTTNAGKARVEGLELESVIALNMQNRFDFSYTWLDAQYRDYFPLGAGIAPDYAGRPLDRSPKNVFTAGYTYTYPLNDGGHIAANVHSRISDSYVVSVTSVPAQYRQPSFTKTDLSLTYASPGNRWYLQAYGMNLENKVQVTNVDSFGNAAISDPRTFGGRIGWKY